MLTFEEAQEILAAVAETSQQELLEDLRRNAVRYATTRAEFQLMDPSQRREADESRTRLHDAFIADCDILARAMVKAGEEKSWRVRLGDDRKRVGDLACWLTAELGLWAR